MEKLDRIFLFGIKVGFAALLLTGLFQALNAAPGWEDATRRSVGSDPKMFSYACTTATSVAVFSNNFKRADGSLQNNSAFTIWIGTANETNSVGQLNSNVAYGQFVLASATFRLDGGMTGTLYCTSDPTAGATATNVRVFEGRDP